MHLFYQPQLSESNHTLDGDEFHHCVKVLRHVVGDKVWVTDGLGLMAKGQISKIEKRGLEFKVMDTSIIERSSAQVNLYIAPTKQSERMEWMVEKLCEIGIASISFLKSENSERPKLKLDRLGKKALAALKQSKGSWLTVINPMVTLDEALVRSASDQRVIAVVSAENEHIGKVIKKNKSTDIFIGPEGDFSLEEIKKAQKAGLVTVGLGDKVLRTETAGLLSSYFVTSINEY